jgi:hypothetical protein
VGPWAAHDDISVQAVYLDDLMSGWQLLNNSFENTQVALFIGGVSALPTTYLYRLPCGLS